MGSGAEAAATAPAAVPVAVAAGGMGDTPVAEVPVFGPGGGGITRKSARKPVRGRGGAERIHGMRGVTHIITDMVITDMDISGGGQDAGAGEARKPFKNAPAGAPVFNNTPRIRSTRARGLRRACEAFRDGIEAGRAGCSTPACGASTSKRQVREVKGHSKWQVSGSMTSERDRTSMLACP
jgi:hypothetical protein